MAETTGSSAITETNKVIINPRAEIDTSPPFESVKEAVDRFGGRGPWIPYHLLRLSAGQEEFDMDKIEEEAVMLERDLILKEHETLNVLKELEAAKRFVEDFKLNLMPESCSVMASPDLKLENNMNSTVDLSLHHVLSPNLMFMELNRAKLNLNKTSGDLAVIQASVESLNKKMTRDKLLLQRRTKMQQIPNSQGDVPQRVEMADCPEFSMTICKDLKQVNFEAEQFKKMTEASRYEVIKAMTEIERTKNSIRMAEMRLNAAKKMEEAAKAVEAIALTERKSDEIILSFEEFQALTRKAQHAEDLCKIKFIDINETHQVEVPILEKFEEIAKENTQSQEVDLVEEKGPQRTNVIAEENYSRMHGPMQHSETNSTKFKFRNSHPGRRSPPVANVSESRAAKEKSMPGLRTTTSIGDILSRKFLLQDDVVAERHVENHSERQHVSLSQMLREQNRLILHPKEDVKVEKQYFVQKKKFGFIQVSLKKKTQPLNPR